MSKDARFRRWMVRVDKLVSVHFGLSVDDLSWIAYRDCYEAGMSPAAMAHKALSEAYQ